MSGERSDTMEITRTAPGIAFAHLGYSTGRHCEERSDKAIQSRDGSLDCFASLVMTVTSNYTFKFIQTAFGSVKFSIAAVPCSRPRPESRSPPHGSRTSV